MTLTRGSTILGARLQTQLEGADFYAPDKFAIEAGAAAHLFPTVKDVLADCFRKYDGLVVFISLGATIRMIAPLLQNKKTDPAVVVVDDKGRFAISVLSGHLGGANALAEQVARILGSVAVITTASDVQQTIAVDLLGREFGWMLEQEQNVTKVSACVVNEEPVALVQETGEAHWWRREGPLPVNIHRFTHYEEVAHTDFSAALIVTDRLLSREELGRFLDRSVIYRPRSLILGVGCDRGTTADEIETLVQQTLREHRLSPNCIRGVASINLKQHEPGLLQFVQKHSLPLTFFTKDELNAVGPLENPSEVVYHYTRAWGVAEPSALKLSGAPTLLVPKVKSPHATLAVARFLFSTDSYRRTPSDAVGE